MTNNKNTCDNCACNRVCDHNKFGFENCNNHIAQLEKCDNTPIKNMEFCDHDVVKYLKEEIHLAEYVDSAYRDCVAVFMLKATLDLINRQQAEIERLQKVNDSFTDIGKLYSEIKTEAIKEFAERLKNECAFECDVSLGYGRPCYEDAIPIIAIDNLVKEMVGEE